MSQLILTCFLAEVLLLSAAYKLYAFGEYKAALADYTLLRRVPFFRALPRRFPWAVPALEIVVGIAMLVPHAQPGAAVASLLIFSSFYLSLAADRRTTIANCGCWFSDGAVPRRVYLLRNLILLAAAATLTSLMLIGRESWPITDRLIVAALTLTIALLVLALPQLTQVLLARPAPTNISDE